MTDQFKASFRKLLSYTKSKWDIDDYPLRYKKQTDTKGKNNVSEFKPWVVKIINWELMIGLGDTKLEAYEDLKSNFKNYLKHDQPPRPGTDVPLRFADTSLIDTLEGVAPGFFDKILNLDYYQCFISDESSLIDFGRDNDETLQKINATYNLGLTDLGDGNIARLLSLIRDKTFK